MGERKKQRADVTDRHVEVIHHMIGCQECSEARYVQAMCARGRGLQATSDRAVSQMMECVATDTEENQS